MPKQRQRRCSNSAHGWRGRRDCQASLADATLSSTGADFMGSVKFQANSNVVSGNATLRETPGELFMLPLMMGLRLHEN